MLAYIQRLNASAEAVKQNQSPKQTPDVLLSSWWDSVPISERAKLWHFDELVKATGLNRQKLPALLREQGWTQAPRRRAGDSKIRVWMPPVKHVCLDDLGDLWRMKFNLLHPSLASQMKAAGMPVPRPLRRYNNAVRRGEVCPIEVFEGN